MSIKRQLLKHSTIYGLGEVLSRCASILLLPIYTHLLTPADYGLIAILDVTVGLLSIVIGAGMVSAVARFHFEAKDHRESCDVWWSGIAFLTVTATIVAAPLILFSHITSDLLFGTGTSTDDTNRFIVLAAVTMWCNCITRLPETYLRVIKASGLVVGMSMSRLLINIGLNITLLVGFEMGVEGVLLGNFITSVLTLCVSIALLISRMRPVRVSSTAVRKLLGFGWPLIATSLLSMAMHDFDRLVLRSAVGLEEVGIYSLAYKVGQAVNMMCLIPFTSIWGVMIYEIARQPDAPRIYANVFEKFVAVLGVLMLGASLFAAPILNLLVDDDFVEAAQLVPIICLAYLFFSMHMHFQVPVLLSKRTLTLMPVFALATVTNLILNLLLIPQFNAFGAAWASVATYAVFSGMGLLRYQKHQRYPYRFGQIAIMLCGQIATYFSCRALIEQSEIGGYIVSFLACALWAVGLLYSEVREIGRGFNGEKLVRFFGRRSVAK